MTETKQEAIMRIGKLLDGSITLTGKDVGGNGRFTQGSYDPAAEERAAIVAWLLEIKELYLSRGQDTYVALEDIAHNIERGEHHGAPPE
jgi:hypothetical protein